MCDRPWIETGWDPIADRHCEAGVEPESVEIPDLPQAVVGWRQWKLEHHDGRPRLVSPLRALMWEPGRPTEAVCLASHAVPDEKCGCGLYGSRDHMSAARAAATGSEMVLGHVKLWGRVIEGELGWRAERAYPGWLIVDPVVDATTIAMLRADYRIPVHRCPAPVMFLSRLLPDVASIRLRVHGNKRRAQVLDLVNRVRTSVVSEESIEPFLDLTGELYVALRAASLTRLPREVARVCGGLSVVPSSWFALLGLSLYGSAAGWPEALARTLWTVVMLSFIGVPAGIINGLRCFRDMVDRRWWNKRRVLFAVSAGPLVAASLLQGLVMLGLTTGRVAPDLLAVFGVIPVATTSIGLVGWRWGLPSPRSRHRPMPVRITG